MHAPPIRTTVHNAIDRSTPKRLPQPPVAQALTPQANSDCSTSKSSTRCAREDMSLCHTYLARCVNHPGHVHSSTPYATQSTTEQLQLQSNKYCCFFMRSGPDMGNSGTLLGRRPPLRAVVGHVLDGRHNWQVGPHCVRCATAVASACDRGVFSFCCRKRNSTAPRRRRWRRNSRINDDDESGTDGSILAGGVVASVQAVR